MKKKHFSIIEISVVLFIILILMMISVMFYKTVQRSIKDKSQQMEFEVIKDAINSQKAGIRSTAKPSSKHVSIYDLIYVHGLLSEHRILLVNGNDKSKSDAQILSYFATPIEVYVTKQKNGATDAQIEAGYLKILGHEYLTGDFEFYYGNDHEVDGGEKGAGPIGTPFGLKGNGTINDGHQYFYKFIYQEPDSGPKHEYRFH